MGSLVPGWDGSTGVPPKELQEFNETDQGQPAGYFARLEQSKSLKRSSVDPRQMYSSTGTPLLTPIPSLQRASSLHQGGPSAPQRSPPLSSSVGTSSMMMRAPGSHPTSAGLHPSTPPKFQPTDWQAELKSLSAKRGMLGAELRRASAADSGDSGRSSAEHHAPTSTSGGGAAQSTTWWAHMDSGMLNHGAAAEAEAAASAATAKDLRGSFRLDLPTGINLH